MNEESKQQLHQLTETVTALGATVTTLTESVASLALSRTLRQRCRRVR